MKNSLLIALFALLAAVMPQAMRADADVSVVIDADFTQFTEGSPTSPVDFPSYGSGSFTSYFPSWLVSKVAKAGGQILIADGGYVRSNSVNLSACGGVVRISTRVKMMDAYGGIVKLSCGYSSANAQTLTFLDSAWHDVSVVLAGGTTAGNVRIEPQFSASGILVRYLKVEQSESFIAAPQPLQPTQADGTSFTARWKSVSGATSYLLNVYSYSESGEKVYTLQNHDVGNVLSYKVTGLDANKTYYFTVCASNGTGVSDPSEEVKVLKVITSLATPTGFSLTGGPDFVKGEWNAVANADFYLLSLNRILTCPSDMVVDMVDEDFSKVTEGSLESVEFIFRDNLDAYTHTAGWSGAELALAQGCMAISPFGNTGWLSSPSLNLTGKDGSFTLRCRMAVGAYGSFYPGTATAALVNAAGDTLQVKSFSLSGTFADYEAEFTGGENDCRVVISYNGDYKLFIDSFTISQLQAAGTKVVTWLGEVETDEPQATFHVERDYDVQITGQVMAAAETVDATGNVIYVYSEPSELVDIDFIPGAVDGVDADEVMVEANGLEVNISLPAPATVSIIDLSGRVVSAVALPAGYSTVVVPAPGIYLLRVGNAAFKLLMK